MLVTHTSMVMRMQKRRYKQQIGRLMYGAVFLIALAFLVGIAMGYYIMT